MRLRVAPYPASFCRAGDESPGCPESSVHSLCRRWIIESPRCSHPSAPPVVRFRVAPSPHPFCCASEQALGCPSPCSPALPAIDRRVAPTFILRRCRLTNSPSCPGFSVLRYRRRSVSGLPRILDLPAPADGSPSLPGLRTIRLCLRRISGSPRTFYSGYAALPISELPQILSPSALPTDVFPGYPESLSFGGPYMFPRVSPIPHLRVGR